MPNFLTKKLIIPIAHEGSKILRKFGHCVAKLFERITPKLVVLLIVYSPNECVS